VDQGSAKVPETGKDLSVVKELVSVKELGSVEGVNNVNLEVVLKESLKSKWS